MHLVSRFRGYDGRGEVETNELRGLYAALPQTAALSAAVCDGTVRTVAVSGLSASAAAMVFAGLSLPRGTTLLFILSDADEAGYFYHDLTQMMGDERVLFFPSSYRRAVRYGQRDAANEILRTEVLARLAGAMHDATPDSLYIISEPDAVSELVPSPGQLAGRTLTVKRGQTADVTGIISTLRDNGFHETDYVYEPGQFALRGSILDVYSFSYESPFRIDFIGDDVSTIRTFDVSTQLSGGDREQAELVAETAGADERGVPLFAFLPADTVVVTRSQGYVCDAVSMIYNEGFSRLAIAESVEGLPERERAAAARRFDKERQLVSGSVFTEGIARFRMVETGSGSAGHAVTVRFNTTPQPLFHKNFDLIKQTFEDYLLRGYKIYILADSPKQNERIRDIIAADEEARAVPIVFTPVDGTLHEGFVDNDLKVCLFTDHQIFDRFHKYNLRSDKARSGKVALTLKEIRQFEIGDYVVHVDHGIGRFGGLLRMPVGDGWQEMIKIQYEHGDCIYVSIHSLYKVSKYRSQDGGAPPRLSRLGSGQWERLKERTKAKIKDIARDLIRLYARRRQEKGFAFSPDTSMQHELEASFLYEDTPDQLRATRDVKADMESARPMDRLVCGDVGFGKTEVAIRAAFKAACDDKQTAVLVPTTVLAYQHFRTFSSRLKDFPVRIEYLSRARSAKKVSEILAGLADGTIDIVIGTHKLISKRVTFHDIGLLIIDEEQKFGVSVKERLRQMKVNVDTLTMTATPIPRTLQFSLLGVRDMSIIHTPPPNRYPIQTEIHTFNADVITEAVNFEMSRGGQVFFVNNRIGDLERIAEMIRKYVPDARVAVAHGQMKPEDLEDIVLGFADYDYDVLVSTTIIENGIDIPNANTIIINGAHNFGLSDLHQMRGRVGRSNRKAFCYLIAPPLASLNKEARRRLEALENFAELGSGINIAMQDLDIRGAGNLLGAEQSGFIAELGYETYQRVLSQAVVELRNDEFPDLYGGADTRGGDYVDDCSFESDIEMYFPDSYVPTDSERMLLYRELDNIKDDSTLAAYRNALTDRFGAPPEVAEELIRVVPLRRTAKGIGCEKVVLKQGRMTLFFVSNPDSPYYASKDFDAVLRYINRHPRRCSLRENGEKRSLTVSDVKSVEEAMDVLKEMTDGTER